MECCSLRCANGSLYEMNSGRVMVAAPCYSIRRIALRHGRQAPHPIRQSIAGVILLAAAVFPLMHLIHWLRHGGVFIDVEAWLLPVPVVGGWALFSAMKRGFYLEIEQNDGKRLRLAFAPDPDPKALDDFLAFVEQACALKVSREHFGS